MKYKLTKLTNDQIITVRIKKQKVDKKLKTTIHPEQFFLKKSNKRLMKSSILKVYSKMIG